MLFIRDCIISSSVITNSGGNGSLRLFQFGKDFFMTDRIIHLDIKDASGFIEGTYLNLKEM